MGLWEEIKDMFRLLLLVLLHHLLEQLQKQPAKPSSKNPAYGLTYPKEYVREYMNNSRLNNYGRPSPYRTELDDLYGNDREVYRRRRQI